jgi:thioredoxin 1
MTNPYREEQPTLPEVEATRGPLVLEFGNDWCGYCRAAQPIIEEAFARHPGIERLKLADAREKRLGRSFGVKLWPTLVFLRDGREVARAVRPRDVSEVADALARIAGTAPG